MANKNNNLTALPSIKTAGELVRDARKGAEVPPELERITPSMAVLFDRVQEAIKSADLMELREKYSDMKTSFFEACSRSAHTLDAYIRAINRLESWSNENGLDLLALTPQEADSFILSETMRNGRTGARAPASIRRDVAGVSAFYSYMNRATNGKLTNPFINSMALPSRRAIKRREVPTEAEISVILENLNQAKIKCAVLIMAKRGLRVGALPGLEIKTREGVHYFTTTTKGREQSGTLSNEIVEELKRCGLSVKRPFSGINTNTLKKQIERELSELAGRGLIPGRIVNHVTFWKDARGTRHDTPHNVTVSVFSCHSFRHYYAVKMYKALNHDIETLRKLLNHQSLNATQNYLNSLGVASGSNAPECL